MTKVALEDIAYFAYHGFYDEEQEVGNHFLLSVSVDIPTFDSDDDNIDDTVNYEKILEICNQQMTKKYRLLESVVMHIAKEIKNKFHNVLTVEVKLAKLKPKMDGQVARAVVSYKI